MVQRVGVIGGGQLAWMMARGAQTLGLELVVQTPSAQDPAVKIAAHTILAAVDDAAATADLATHCDVITFENEFVDLATLSKLAQTGVVFHPSLAALEPILDKFDQRSAFHAWGIPTPRFLALPPNADIEVLRTFGFPVVLKARRHGYDGYGTFILDTLEALQTVLQQKGDRPWLLEEFVPFERELAVMAARSATGEVVIYPVVESQQENQVCRRVFVLPEGHPSVKQAVEAIATTLLTQLDYVGVMGIELFLTAQGQVLVNELAPRTHNSGHYTLDACVTSQFEQQLRAVCGLPLGSAALTYPGAVMVNLLGFEASDSDYLAQRQALSQLPNAHVYWYGKAQSRPGRKLGHVTVCLNEAQTRQDTEAIAHQIEALWYPA